VFDRFSSYEIRKLHKWFLLYVCCLADDKFTSSKKITLLIPLESCDLAHDD
jgi:hypothetical protein